MRPRRVFILCAAVLALALAGAPADARTDQALHAICAKAVRDACEQFKADKVTEDAISVSVIDLSGGNDQPRFGGFRGDQPTFPASVVKIFYLAAAHEWLERGKLQDSDELRRTMRDMIVESSNDATAMIVDALTNTLNGPPLGDAEMKAWVEQRNAVNRFFAAAGYANINVCQKTYCEGPYGRERVFFGPKFENRNKLTSDATARLMMEIARGTVVSPERSQQMMDLLKRDPKAKPAGPDDQNTGFIGGALPAGSKLWSKAGWTGTARHDAAYLELADGNRAVIVIFTTARQRKLIPAVARQLTEGLQNGKHGLIHRPSTHTVP